MTTQRAGSSDDDRGVSSAPLRRDPLFVLGLAVFVIGLALRLWVLGRSPLNSDEAFVALMAREVLRGHFFAFLWGQHYGGGEFYVVAGLFALFGQSRLVFGLAPVLLDAVAAVLVWRVGRRLFDDRIGALAAIMFWIWPAAYLYLSTIEYGFRYLALVCGLVVVLFARCERRRRRRRTSMIGWCLASSAAWGGGARRRSSTSPCRPCP